MEMCVDQEKAVVLAAEAAHLLHLKVVINR